MQELLNIVVPLPKYKHSMKKTKTLPKRSTMRLALLNNVSSWYRWKKTEVKNTYKEILKDFYIPTAPSIKYKELVFSYTILRHTKQKIDADSIA